MAEESCSCVTPESVYFPSEWCLVCEGTGEVESKERPTCLDCNDSGLNKDGNGWCFSCDGGRSKT